MWFGYHVAFKKGNPYHDAQGLFASADGSGAGKVSVSHGPHEYFVEYDEKGAVSKVHGKYAAYPGKSFVIHDAEKGKAPGAVAQQVIDKAEALRSSPTEEKSSSDLPTFTPEQARMALAQSLYAPQLLQNDPEKTAAALVLMHINGNGPQLDLGTSMDLSRTGLFSRDKPPLTQEDLDRIVPQSANNLAPDMYNSTSAIELLGSIKDASLQSTIAQAAVAKINETYAKADGPLSGTGPNGFAQATSLGKQLMVESAGARRVLNEAASLFGGPALDQAADTLDKENLDRVDRLKMFSSDYNTFKPAFVSSWTVAGGTSAYARAYSALQDFGANDGKDLWMGSDKQGSYSTAAQAALEPSANMRSNLEQMYQETQDFYSAKFKGADLAGKELVLMRGVGGNAQAYTPAPVESWTTDKATPDRFGKMMGNAVSSRGMTQTEYSVLTTRTNYKNVFATYESLKGFFPPESDLKGKKEFIVFGGGLDNIESDLRYATRKADGKKIPILPAHSPEAQELLEKGKLGVGLYEEEVGREWKSPSKE